MALSKPSETSRVTDEILSCGICQQIVNAPIVLACYHSFCNDCLEQQRSKQEKKDNNFRCPTCAGISPADTKGIATFITDLLQLYKPHHNAKCVQCQCTKANFACTECELYLCEQCKLSHLRIPLLKDHHVTPCDENKNSNGIIDKSVYCTHHTDNEIKFNCKDCEMLLCCDCKNDGHGDHRTETIVVALWRLQPILQSKLTNLKTIAASNVSTVELIESEQANIKRSTTQIKEALGLKKKQLIDHIEKCFSEMFESVEANEQHDLNETAISMSSEKHSLSKLMTITQLGRLALDTYKNCSLLRECQTWLKSCLEQMEVEMSAAHNLEFKSKTQVLENIDKLPSKDELFGTLRSVTGIQYRLKTPIERQNRKQFENGVSISNFAEHEWRIDGDNISLKGAESWQKINIIDARFWLTCPEQNKINVLKLDGSKVVDVEHYEIKGPRSVCKIADCVLTAADSGLFCLNSKGKLLYKVGDGKFSDITQYIGKTYALEWDKGQVWYIGTDNEEEKLSCLNTITIKYPVKSHYDTLAVNENIFVSAWNNHKVHVYNSEGNTLIKVEDHSYRPVLYAPNICSGGDTGEDTVIIADSGHNRLFSLKLKDDGSEVWTKVQLEGVQGPTDIIITGSKDVWCLHSFGENIAKLELSK